MATTTTAPPTSTVRRPSARRHLLLRELDRPADAVAHLGPNWFASVMGTGIVANAAMLLPHRTAGLEAFALGVWTLAAAWLLVLLAATAAHWARHTETARGHLADPAAAPFYGTPPMALLTVGAGALLVGHQPIGMPAAIVVAFVLWTVGTAGGLLAGVVVPLRLLRHEDVALRDVAATWLLPVVPPMVSAATGAALLPHLPAGPAREALLVACYVLFGLSLAGSVVLIPLVWWRLARRGAASLVAVPTAFLVLGPLGQSVTAAGLLGNRAHLAVGSGITDGLRTFGVAFGVPVLTVALLWLVVATALVMRARRAGLPFAMTWWSTTFPLGTVVTGTSLLAVDTGTVVLGWVAVGLYVALVAVWAVVAARTLHGAAWTGRLLRPA